MNPDETRTEDEWPLPPPWMWDCADCAELYRAMRLAGDRVAELRPAGDRRSDWDPFDSTLTTQMALGAHLVARHRDLLPDWDPACEACAHHRNRIAQETHSQSRKDAVLRFGGEHLARHIYAPPRVVGIL